MLAKFGRGRCPSARSQGSEELSCFPCFEIDGNLHPGPPFLSPSRSRKMPVCLFLRVWVTFVFAMFSYR